MDEAKDEATEDPEVDAEELTDEELDGVSGGVLIIPPDAEGGSTIGGTQGP